MRVFSLTALITPYSNARAKETDTEGGVGGEGFAPSVSAITGVEKRPQICVKPHKEREKEIIWQGMWRRFFDR